MSAVISIHRERFKKVRAVNQGQGHGQLSLTDAHGEQVGLSVSTAETLGLKLCRFRKKGVRYTVICYLLEPLMLWMIFLNVNNHIRRFNFYVISETNVKF